MMETFDDGYVPYRDMMSYEMYLYYKGTLQYVEPEEENLTINVEESSKIDELQTEQNKYISDRRRDDDDDDEDNIMRSFDSGDGDRFGF